VCGDCRSVCCQDAKPPLTKNRQKIIQEYLEKQQSDINQPFRHEQYSYPAVDEHLYCRLFDKKTKKCTVHPVKPETCRAGPITFDINFKTRKLEYFLKSAKICALAGVLYENQAVFKVHFEAAKPEIKRLVEQLSADELYAILKIEEPDTFKVGEEDLSMDVIKKLRVNLKEP